jgi:trehalose 6-phosphate phosphatase
MSLPAAVASALAVAARSPSLLVATDFDGVLAPLVLDPSTSRALPGTIETLTALADLPHTYSAVVSGRDLDTLTELTGLEGASVTRIGSHGSQTSDSQTSGSQTSDSETSGSQTEGLSDAQSQTLSAVTEDMEALLTAHPGAYLEHKPSAVVLHTRRMPPGRSDAAEAAALEVSTRHTDVHVLRGKHVVEVSVVRADKGTALLALRDAVGATAVVYFGDDVTDEDAFERLGERDVTVKVGDGDTAARYRVTSPEDVASALTLLLEGRSER